MQIFFESTLILALLWLCFEDAKQFRIPNLAVSIVVLSQLFLQPLLFESFAMPILSFLALFLLNIGFKRIKGVLAIGAGDLKLIFALSIGFTGEHLVFFLWLASLLGLIALKLFKLHNEKIPFGIYLSISFLVLHFNLFNLYFFMNQ